MFRVFNYPLMDEERGEEVAGGGGGGVPQEYVKALDSAMEQRGEPPASDPPAAETPPEIPPEPAQQQTPVDATPPADIETGGDTVPANAGSDESSSAANAPSHQHDDDLVRLARAFGIPNESIDTLSPEALNVAISTAGNVWERARASQQPPEIYQQTPPQQQVPPQQPDPQQAPPQPQSTQFQPQQQQQPPQPEQPQVDPMEEVFAGLRKSGYDDDLVKAMEQQHKFQQQTIQQLTGQLHQQEQFLAGNAQVAQQREMEAVEQFIDSIGDEARFGTRESATQEQIAAAQAVYGQVRNMQQMTGQPVSAAMVNVAYANLYGRQNVAETQAAKTNAAKAQSRRVMGSSSTEKAPSQKQWDGSPEQDPEIHALWKGFQEKNGVAVY